ncbi:hypothetical protein TREES_T100020611 [Tupaia chinensis]|uniref:Uncharacterized protein n=1 Tax=Tupaia chinensis TaxID=246437 RepID=L9KP97_TUPCH|nr:hypothetical protein TREES_T100020611 [Tupaia chinensis]
MDWPQAKVGAVRTGKDDRKAALVPSPSTRALGKPPRGPRWRSAVGPFAAKAKHCAEPWERSAVRLFSPGCAMHPGLAVRAYRIPESRNRNTAPGAACGAAPCHCLQAFPPMGQASMSDCQQPLTHARSRCAQWAQVLGLAARSCLLIAETPRLELLRKAKDRVDVISSLRELTG